MISTMHMPRMGFQMGDAFEAFRREMGSFDRYLDRDFGLLLHGELCAPVALWEDDAHIYLEVEVPGVSRDDLELTIHQGNLRLFAEREAPEGKREYWFNERRYGRFDRIIPLPEAVDPNEIDAELNDGILHLALTKKPEAYSKRIAVHSRNGGKK